MTKNLTELGRTLKYPDGSLHPVKIPFASWASAQILGQIAHILLSEVMGYSVVLLENTGMDSGQPVRYAAGCIDILDPTCSKYDVMAPQVHFTIESWPYGISVASALPPNIQPELLSVLSYNIFDANYLWASVVEDGATQKVSLDYYKSYDAARFQPHRFFDPWQRMLELVPAKYIVRCSDMLPGSINDRNVETYMRVRTSAREARGSRPARTRTGSESESKRDGTESQSEPGSKRGGAGRGGERGSHALRGMVLCLPTPPYAPRLMVSAPTPPIPPSPLPSPQVPPM